MPRESKKSQASRAAEGKPKSVEQLVLDQMVGKYDLVPLASVWALELRRREENRHLSQPEILDLALRDILTGQIAPEEIRKRADEITAQTFAALQAGGKAGKDEKERR
ncbi:MAG: hypothetical protein HY551_04350 [Elusimicrobia bacterium]|nr:hypothetical protein [Elusimicrobiota bacterium]